MKCNVCDKRAYFKWPGDTRLTHCKFHKEYGMISPDSCELCETIAYYNYKTPGQKAKGRFCARHKLDGMVNVNTKLCDAPGCNVRAIFKRKLNDGDDDDTAKCSNNTMFCAKHKHESMQRNYLKTCSVSGCQKQPYFRPSNLPGKGGIVCADHMEPGMVSVRNCLHAGCNKRAMFNVGGVAPRFCSHHKKEGMIYNPQRKCAHSECSDIALWGEPGCRAEACDLHKTHRQSMNFVERACNSCALVNVVDPVTQLCAACGDWSKRLRKQLLVKVFFDKHMPSMAQYVSYDSVVDGGAACGKERPDFMFYNAASHTCVVVEVDEYQHKNRPEECERVRMLNLFETIGSQYYTGGSACHVTFIRWNPDTYKTPAGSPSSMADMDTRLWALKQETLHRLCYDTGSYTDTYVNKVENINSMVTAVYMFYDFV